MGRDANSTDPDAAPEYNSAGVDVSLIRWMLTLTPQERLEFLENRIEDLNQIWKRNAGSWSQVRSGNLDSGGAPPVCAPAGGGPFFPV